MCFLIKCMGCIRGIRTTPRVSSPGHVRDIPPDIYRKFPDHFLDISGHVQKFPEAFRDLFGNFRKLSGKFLVSSVSRTYPGHLTDLLGNEVGQTLFAHILWEWKTCSGNVPQVSRNCPEYRPDISWECLRNVLDVSPLCRRFPQILPGHFFPGVLFLESNRDYSKTEESSRPDG